MKHVQATLCLLSLLACNAPSAMNVPPRAHVLPPLRIGIQHWLRSEARQEESLLPLVYSNHLPKSLAFETLVATDASGRLVPQLAESWESSDDRLRWTFTLRPNARFHDGKPCDAAAVARYFQSWLVSDEDRFIGACERIKSVRALDSRRVEFTLSEPYPLDLDLPLFNPMAIVGHDLARSDEGLTSLIGTGPWRIVEHEPMQRVRYERFDEYDGQRGRSEAIEYRIFAAGSDRDPVGAWALERGHIDALIESWRPSISRDAAKRLEGKGFQLFQTRGSMVQLLCFQTERGPFQALAWRARVAQAIDRRQLVDVAEKGFADPVTTLFAPWLEAWPDAAVGVPPTIRSTDERVQATLLVLESDIAQVHLGLELARQLARVGIDLEVDLVSTPERNERIERGDFDMFVHRTWGSPYDPHATLYDRLGLRAPVRQRTAGGLSAAFLTDPEIQRLVEESWRAPTSAARRVAYASIQRWIDEHAALVPLYVPRRLALARKGFEGLDLGEDIYRIDLRAARMAVGEAERDSGDAVVSRP